MSGPRGPWQRLRREHHLEPGAARDARAHCHSAAAAVELTMPTWSCGLADDPQLARLGVRRSAVLCPVSPTIAASGEHTCQTTCP